MIYEDEFATVGVCFFQWRELAGFGAEYFCSWLMRSAPLRATSGSLSRYTWLFILGVWFFVRCKNDRRT